MSVLLVAGFGVFVTGLVTVAFGISIKEFSFGDTLVVSGAVVSCTGLMMISLSIVVRELRGVADQLGSGAVADQDGGVRASGVRASLPPDRRIDDGPPRSDGDRVASGLKSDPSATPSALSPRWQAEVVDRDGATVVSAPDAELPAFSDSPSQPKPRRNLLFASMMKERERAVAERPGSAGLSAPAIRAADRDMPGTASSEAPRPALRADHLSGPADHNGSPVTVVRSGVVNGMGYSLYSDGSIDAQLPEGVMRFASIDRLRAHLDQSPDRSFPK
ncbi:hypothetical protein NB311A_18031 [Nitrobacter sp. Nb-311A]|uniref:hypothetical protein n=1 Tax=unclassified Nitrobacter TaxID=2620411 RepID=UPI00006873FF|nr:MULTISPECIES: hypothetical protein [unclassified Nitrobacter]EAQ35389.1 hypothetical protein NB311A_18031 [Nitrobacter sp. Nb-311A]MCB1391881.1 hypothetical protein [Nitrobacter sp.]MCV0385057.1 hypothetical protein [Nitrobacter sp.]